MTTVQEQAIEIIKQLPDYKVEALLMLASDELELKKLRQKKKKEALHNLLAREIELPDGFDPDKELMEALEEKYGPVD